MMVMDISSADARVGGFNENLMGSERWSGDCLGNGRTTGSACPCLESEQYFNDMLTLNQRSEYLDWKK
jgi:hypothetical protein